MSSSQSRRSQPPATRPRVGEIGQDKGMGRRLRVGDVTASHVFAHVSYSTGFEFRPARSTRISLASWPRRFVFERTETPAATWRDRDCQIHRLSDLDVRTLTAVGAGAVRSDSRFPAEHIVALPTRPVRTEKLAPWAVPRLLRLGLVAPGSAHRQPATRPGQSLPHAVTIYELSEEGQYLAHCLAENVARCRVCGCTEDRACPGGCWWVPDPEMGDLCSACPVDLDQADAR